MFLCGLVGCYMISGYFLKEPRNTITAAGEAKRRPGFSALVLHLLVPIPNVLLLVCFVHELLCAVLVLWSVALFCFDLIFRSISCHLDNGTDHRDMDIVIKRV